MKLAHISFLNKSSIVFRIMSDNSSGNKRIVKNSVFMAIRMVFVLGITFYTTRIILDVLGVEDYGVYNVVCGFVSMFAFLNTSMSNGIQRYYNVELEKNGIDGANKVFNNALVIQALIAFLIVILTESFGLWYLHNKMVIPADRILAAEWIFQCSIASFLFLILQAPFVASVMAHEKMDYYAIVSIIDAVLKLIIVYGVSHVGGDKLIVYGMLLVLVNVIDFLFYWVYCRVSFGEIRIKRAFNKAMFGSMLGFSGWNIFGSLSSVMKEQGINLVLNLFFGPVVNAARGIAQQINGGLQSFVSNITTPVRPQVIKSYARGDYDRTMKLIYSVSKLSCCFLYICALPVALEIDYILKLWLGSSIPAYTNLFVILIIAISFVNNLNSAVSAIIHASGKMMVYQTVSSSIAMLSIPFAYLGLRYGFPPEFAIIMVLFWTSLAQVASLIILKTVIQYSVKEYIKKVLVPLFLLALLTFWPSSIVRFVMEDGLIRFFIVGCVSILVSAFGIYFIALEKSERDIIDRIINKIIK